MSSNTLAVIPARGGSKRISKKNIRSVAGKPLIAHTIEHAEKANNIERAIVSTDSDEIAQVAREYGGEVPFKRPAELATDTASSAEAISHALQWANKQGYEYDYICALQVTSPLRHSGDIDGTLQTLEKTRADSCISVSKYITPPQWAVATNDEGYLEDFFDCGMLWSEESYRTQSIPDLFHPNGAVFAATTDAWRRYETFYTPKTLKYEMPPQRSFDIDKPWELELVRLLADKFEGKI